MTDEPQIDDRTMTGVYQAMCRHGYAELTMQHIAAACDTSTSLLHYHHDTKEDLLVSFLDRLLSEYKQHIQSRDDHSPERRLVEFVAWYVFPPDETDRESYHAALLELRSQGPYNDRIQRKLQASDTILRETVEEILRDGIAENVFRPVDVDRTAALLVATLDGARTRQLTLGSSFEEHFYTKIVAEAALSRIVEPLLVDGVALPELEAVLADSPARTGENFWADTEST